MPKDHILTRIVYVMITAVLAVSTLTINASDFVPLQNHDRIFSPHGFSFLPPQAPNWLEQFGQDEISFLKQTDLQIVSFYTGAIEGMLGSRISSKEDLIEFVRSKKDIWGDDGRYSNISSSFQIDDQQESCVRYVLSANDQNATNRGGHEFLLMKSVGKFCLHPDDPEVAVDIYYSVRHVPQFDPKDLVSEGERFLQSLQFSTRRNE